MNRMNSTHGLPLYIHPPARTQLQISMDALGQNETLDRRWSWNRLLPHHSYSSTCEMWHLTSGQSLCLMVSYHLVKPEPAKLLAQGLLRS